MTPTEAAPRWGSLALVGAFLLVGSGPVVAVPVTLLTQASGSEREAIATTVSLIPADSDAGEARRVHSHEAPGRLEVDVPLGSLWRVSVTAPDFWAKETFVVGAEDSEVEVELYATGEAAADLRLPEGSELSRPIEATFEPSAARPRSAAEISGTVLCPTTSEPDRVSCALPAGVWDLHLHHPGFASVHRWDVEVHAEEVTTLDSLELRPGSSLVGAVALDHGALEAMGDIEIQLLPLTRREVTARPVAERRLESLARSTRPNPRGFFQLTDLSAGTYALKVQARGYADLVQQPVRIFESRETILDRPLELHRPVDLKVFVDPPSAPGGEPWRVELRSLEAVAGAVSEKLEDTIGPGGAWTGQGLNPGRYWLTVRSGRASSWWSEEVEVEGPETKLDLNLNPVTARGEVLYGGEPIQARLVFGGVQAKQRIETFTDDEGRFETSLPRAGIWRLAIQLQSKASLQSVEPVDLEEGGGWLSIELDDRRLLGEVVDPAGKAVPNVKVRVVRLDGTGASRHDKSEMVTSRDGRFGFFGLPEGRYSINLLSAVHSAPGVVLDLEGHGTEEPIRLVVEKLAPVTGRVVAARGPVAGALVYLYPETPEPRRTPIRQWITDPTGHFEATVPESTRAMAFMVLAPGHAAKMFQVAGRPEEPLEIPVDDVSGTLVLEMPSADVPAPNLSYQGSPAWLALLERWAQMHGNLETDGRQILPSMAVGSYRLCVEGRCDEGFLPPNGELVLRAAF